MLEKFISENFDKKYFDFKQMTFNSVEVSEKNNKDEKLLVVNIFEDILIYENKELIRTLRYSNDNWYVINNFC